MLRAVLRGVDLLIVKLWFRAVLRGVDLLIGKLVLRAVLRGVDLLIGKLVLRTVLGSLDLLIGKLWLRAVLGGMLTCKRALLQVGCRGPPGGGEGPMKSAPEPLLLILLTETNHVISVEEMTKTHPFVKSVKHIAGLIFPVVTLYTDQQLIGIERFCCREAGSVLCIDKTFNLGEFHVTPTVY